MIDQSELFENRARGWRAFGGRRGLAPAERGKHLGNARVDRSRGMPACQIDASIVGDHLIDRLAREIQVEKQIQKVSSDVAAQQSFGDVVAAASRQYFLDRSADVASGVHQRPVDVEQVNRKWRNHAGCGPPSSMPGARRPDSGLITCCVPSPAGGACTSASLLPSINLITSLPSRTS